MDTDSGFKTVKKAFMKYEEPDKDWPSRLTDSIPGFDRKKLERYLDDECGVTGIYDQFDKMWLTDAGRRILWNVLPIWWKTNVANKDVVYRFEGSVASWTPEKIAVLRKHVMYKAGSIDIASFPLVYDELFMPREVRVALMGASPKKMLQQGAAFTSIAAKVGGMYQAIAPQGSMIRDLFKGIWQAIPGAFGKLLGIE